MHPGPINHGVEMMPDVLDDPRSVVMKQVTNGIAIRMALFIWRCLDNRGCDAICSERGT